ncbi:hypothetical protein BD779DRAFT_1616964 [Infundibulicybe gibba]|nr:hypothetical protein BD779DRAFT_1616964 [Infundibulicybe gibba]
MAPPRGTGPSSSLSPASTAHSLSLLAEYTHTLDSLPLDLSRNFADLRELDAVLSSSTSSITTKITSLTHMIEQGRAPKEERLWLLAEIAEEATRLKLGGEDKIRVACQAADNLKSHASHMRTLAEHIPGFDANTLNRKTSYPHVAAGSFMPTNSLRGGVFGSLLVSAPDPSPAKRERTTRDEDLDIPHPRSPKKGRNSDRNRNGSRAKKNDRAASPAESLLSVVSHIQPQNNASSSRSGGGSRNNNSNNNSNTSTNHPNVTNVASAPKRPRLSASTNNHSNTNGARNSSQTHDHYPHPDSHHTSGAGGNGNSHSGAHTNGNSRRDAFNVPPSSSAHPSLPPPYHPPNGSGTHGHHTHHTIPPGGYDLQHSLTPDWNPPSAHQLEGPGMPVARGSSALPGLGLGHGVSSIGMSLSTSGGGGNASVNGANGGGTDAGTEAGDGEADGDDKTYCICDTVSYGEMIACDDNQCEKEWFHLTCIGLTVPPEGRWFCESCLARKNAKRSNRTGKRKSAANRSGARAG